MTQDLTKYTIDYYKRDQTFAKYKILRSDQLAALCYALNWPFWGYERDEERDPGFIVSIGAGRGELESQLEALGFEVIGVDPSSGSHALYRGKTLLHTWTPTLVGLADTLIFCESIEHIPIDQTLEVLSNVKSGARIIIVNFVDFFPIIPTVDDGWDHITRVDDALYDQLSRGRVVVLRERAHLVLDVP